MQQFTAIETRSRWILVAALALGCFVEEWEYDEALDPIATQSAQAGSGGGSPRLDNIKDTNGTLERCENYCGKVVNDCTRAGSSSQRNSSNEGTYYSDMDSCMALCQHFPPGTDEKDVQSNTLSCRESILDPLVRNFDDEISEFEYCQGVIPGGTNESFQCGSTCESYCQLYQDICGEVEATRGRQKAEDCISNCALLPDAKKILDTKELEGRDTIQCRLVQLSKAALGDEQATDNCPSTLLNQVHSAILKTDGWSPCTEPEIKEENSAKKPSPLCDSFCSLVTNTCTGDDQVYRSEEECRAVCGVLPPGTSRDNGTGTTDESQNTVGCRNYHAYNSIGNSSHCTHAGPTGDGHCGPGNCFSYCQILEAGCPANYEREFNGKMESCLRTCRVPEPKPGKPLDWQENGFKGNGGPYNPTKDMPRETLLCRTSYAVNALTGNVDDPEMCEAAIGEGDCKPL